MNSIKRIIQKELKLQSKSMQFTSIKTVYRKDTLFFLHNNDEIGYLGYTFVSNKFCEYGSQLGLYISCRFGKEMKGKIRLTEAIDKLNLTYKTGANLPNCYFGFTSLYFLSDKFYSKGIVSFFEEDNINQKVKEIIDKIKLLYLPVIDNFINNTDSLIDDIIKYPKNYGYPMASILITCYLNNQTSLIENIITKTKSQNMYDNSSSKVNSLIKKIEKFLENENKFQ